MEGQILLMFSIICAIFLIAAFFSDIENKREINAIAVDLSKVKFENLKIERFVNIKMQSGDVFKNVTMEEYKSINDPMKKGSYRIHRKAIESEFHFTKGTGTFEFEGKTINVEMYGDEKGVVKEAYTRDIISEKPYVTDVKWYLNYGNVQEITIDYLSLSERFYEFT